MKKIFAVLSLLLAFVTIACSNNKKEKEVIVVPERTTTPVVIVKDPPAKNTTVTLDRNGVKVETKKVDVKVGN